MVRPASHPHSNGATATTQSWRPSTKKITAEAASGGSRRARSVVSPLTYDSSAGDRIVSCGPGPESVEGPWPECAGGTNSDNEPAAARARILTPLSRRVGYQRAICGCGSHVVFYPIPRHGASRADERKPIVGVGRPHFVDEILHR